MISSLWCRDLDQVAPGYHIICCGKPYQMICWIQMRTNQTQIQTRTNQYPYHVNRANHEWIFRKAMVESWTSISKLICHDYRIDLNTVWFCNLLFTNLSVSNDISERDILRWQNHVNNRWKNAWFHRMYFRRTFTELATGLPTDLLKNDRLESNSILIL